MRIGLIAPPWLPVPPPRYGGTEEVLDVLARGLKSAGHDVLLFTTGDSTSPVPSAYAHPSAVRDRMGCSIPELYHVLHAYEALHDRDVIHDHTIVGPFVAGLFGRRKVVTTNHGPFDDEIREIYRALDERIALVAISHDQASRARGVRVARVIHHGLDPSDYTPGRGSGGYLLFLGRMSPDKGAHLAARVARAAGKRLLIAAKLEEACEHRYFHDEVVPLLDEDVEYVGEVDRATKLRLLADAEALVNPVSWPEPFGLVMIEALAVGTPVVALGCGSVPEIVDDGSTGFVCGDERAMVDALARLDEIDRLDCRRRFEDRFAARRMVDEHVALYREVMDATDEENAAAA